MAEMSREQEARLIEKHCQSNCGAGWLTVKAMRSGASALRKLDELEKWCAAMIGYYERTREFEAQAAVVGFVSALTGDMQMPPESED